MEIAELAKARLDRQFPEGSLLARRAQIAADLKVTKETLHNYLRAREFVNDVAVADRAFAKALTKMSATSVGVYARWYQRDAESAVTHAAAAAANGWSAARITLDERKARETVLSPPKLLDIALGSARRKHQANAVSGLVAEALSRGGAGAVSLGWLVRSANTQPLSKAMGAGEVLGVADQLMELNGQPWTLSKGWKSTSEIIAVIEIDRGGPGDAHRRNARNIVARGALAATVHPLVMVLVADEDALDEFVNVVPILEAHRLGTPLPGAQAFMLVPGYGSILVAAADTFASSWSGVAY